jgi:hypothetical protein
LNATSGQDATSGANTTSDEGASFVLGDDYDYKQYLKVLMNESQAGAHEADYDGESPVPII